VAKSSHHKNSLDVVSDIERFTSKVEAAVTEHKLTNKARQDILDTRTSGHAIQGKNRPCMACVALHVSVSGTTHNNVFSHASHACLRFLMMLLACDVYDHVRLLMDINVPIHNRRLTIGRVALHKQTCREMGGRGLT
jgi:hypothetical protein